MDFTSRYPIRQLTVLAQDPSVTDAEGKPLLITVPVPTETLAPGPKGYRIQIIDFDSTEDLYYMPAPVSEKDRYTDVKDFAALLADRDFHAQNTFGHIATTLAQFESALGRHVNWAFESLAHHIKVAPHAFLDANAFYSRRDEALCFGYFPIDSDGQAATEKDYVYTCLSADIVTHETTHAILDGLRRELMRPSTPDQPAFHEGFADIIALLSALSRPQLLKLVLPVEVVEKRELIQINSMTPDALKESVLLGLAKQFGKVLAKQHLMNRSATALRRSVELDAEKDNYDSMLARGAEAHELGELIVAALLNAFIEIWYARALTLDPTKSGYADRDRVIEDGAEAAQDLLHMSIRAIDYIPPVNMTYPDYLTALLTVDHELMQGRDGEFHYRKHIAQSFKHYGIVPVTGSGCWDPPTPYGDYKLRYGFSGHAEMTWDREAIMRFLWENRDALRVNADALTSVNFVKPSVRTGPDGFLLRETIVEYMQLLDVTGVDLEALEIRQPDDMPNDATVRLLGGGTLVFDDYGNLKFHIGSGVASGKQSEHVAATWRAPAEKLGFRQFEALHRQRIIGDSMTDNGGW